MSFNTLVLVEPVNPEGDYPASRIKSYRFEGWDGAAWVELAKGGSPARVQIRVVRPVTTKRLRLTIEASEQDPGTAEIGAYYEPRCGDRGQ